MRCPPDFALCDRIPGQQTALVLRQIVDAERIVIGLDVPVVSPEIDADCPVGKSFVEKIDARFLLGGNVNETGIRAL